MYKAVSDFDIKILGWFVYLKADRLNNKAYTIWNELRKREDRTDQEQDFLDEYKHIYNETRKRFVNWAKTKL